MAAETLTITAQPRRFLPYLIIALGFVAIGLALPAISTLERIESWSAIVFFGICAVIFLTQMVPGANVLMREPDGIDVRTLWRRYRIGFAAVDGPFRILIIGDPANFPGLGWLARLRFFPRNTMVGVRMRGPAAQGRLAQWNLARYGIHGAIPATYGRSPDQLATLLNAHLDRWRERSS